MKNPKNAGRKLKYGEPTVLMRIPESMVDQIQALLEKRIVLEDIVAYPKNVQYIIDSVAEIMNSTVIQVQDLKREIIIDALRGPDEKTNPRLLNVLAQYDSTLPSPNDSLEGAKSVITGFFDDVVESTKLKFLD